MGANAGMACHVSLAAYCVHCKMLIYIYIYIYIHCMYIHVYIYIRGISSVEAREAVSPLLKIG